MKKCLAAALLLSVGSTPVYAVGSGFYAGAQLGYAQTGFDAGHAIVPINGMSSDYSKNGEGFTARVPESLKSAFFPGKPFTTPIPLTPLAAYSQKEDSNNISGRVFLGYQFNPYFATEFGYSYFANTTLNISGTSGTLGTSGSTALSATQTLHNEIQEQAQDLTTKWIYPYRDDLSFYLKLGAALLNVSQTFTKTTTWYLTPSDGPAVPDTTTAETLSSSTRSVRPLLGAGLDVGLTDNAFVELDFMHIQGNTKVPSVEFGTIGVVYHFA